MGGELPELIPFPRQDDKARERESRIQGRRLLREMTHAEIEVGPLTRRRRRELIQYAQRMGIDAFEAGLLVRAAEFECGSVTPLNPVDRRQEINDDYLMEPEVKPLASRFSFISLVLLVLVLDYLLIFLRTHPAP